MDHGAEGFQVTWVVELNTLRRLVKVKNISSVLGRHKVGNYGHPLGLSRRVGNRSLDYALTFLDLSE